MFFLTFQGHLYKFNLDKIPKFYHIQQFHFLNIYNFVTKQGDIRRHGLGYGEVRSGHCEGKHGTWQDRCGVRFKEVHKPHQAGI